MPVSRVLRDQGSGSGILWRTSKEDALKLAKEIVDGLTGGNTLTDEERSLFLRYRDGFSACGLFARLGLGEKDGARAGLLRRSPGVLSLRGLA